MRPTKEQLLACQDKGYQEDFLIAYIYRPISIKITKYIAKTFLTPNQISLIGFFSALISAYCFIFPTLKTDILGIVFMHLAIVFDCVDGEIARLKNIKSEFGFWLDGMAVKAGEIAIYFGLALGLICNFIFSNNYYFSSFPYSQTFILILLAILIASRFLVVTANEALHLLPKGKRNKVIEIPKILTGEIFKKFKKLNLFSYNVQTFYLLITLGVILNQILLIFLLLIAMNISVFLIVGIRLYKFKR